MTDITERYVFDPRLLGLREVSCRCRKAAEAELWQMYEREKAMLENMTLTPKEYERAIRDLTRRLGL